ncbi:hypothetical protein [Paraburkholderia sp. SIMBA_054]|uniref:hypothetical protein n=1 Tax=Paraburkholderia sp. SIMBA_054 TaxID=3085795 RepID=UPI00397E1076
MKEQTNEVVQTVENQAVTGTVDKGVLHALVGRVRGAFQSAIDVAYCPSSEPFKGASRRFYEALDGLSSVIDAIGVGAPLASATARTLDYLIADNAEVPFIAINFVGDDPDEFEQLASWALPVDEASREELELLVIGAVTAANESGQRTASGLLMACAAHCRTRRNDGPMTDTQTLAYDRLVKAAARAAGEVHASKPVPDVHFALAASAREFAQSNAIARVGDVVETKWGDWKSSHRVRVTAVGAHLVSRWDVDRKDFIAGFAMNYTAERLRKDGTSAERSAGCGICLTNLRTDDGQEWDQGGRGHEEMGFNHAGLSWLIDSASPRLRAPGFDNENASVA